MSITALSQDRNLVEPFTAVPQSQRKTREPQEGTDLLELLNTRDIASSDLQTSVSSAQAALHINNILNQDPV